MNAINNNSNKVTIMIIYAMVFWIINMVPGDPEPCIISHVTSVNGTDTRWTWAHGGTNRALLPARWQEQSCSFSSLIISWPWSEYDTKAYSRYKTGTWWSLLITDTCRGQLRRTDDMQHMCPLSLHIYISVNNGIVSSEKRGGGRAMFHSISLFMKVLTSKR